MLGQTTDLVAERDRIGLEINRLLQLLDRIEFDPATESRYYGPGNPNNIIVSNPDYIADEGTRAEVRADIEAQIAQLRVQQQGVVNQFYGGGDPSSTVVRVTSQQTPAGPVQVVTSAPMVQAPPNGSGASMIILDDDGGGGGGPPFLPPDDFPPPPPGPGVVVTEGDGQGDDTGPADGIPSPSTGPDTGGKVAILLGIAAIALLASRNRG